jgi:serine/threonine protein kinase
MTDSNDNDKTRIQMPRQARPAAKPAPAQAPAKDGGVNPVPGKTRLSERAVKTTENDVTVSLPSGAPSASRGSPPVQSHEVLKNRFILERVLGAGGMGVVYKAKDLLKVEAKDRDPYVAIKVLGEEFKSHPEAFIALQRESRKTQRIAHPNIVNVYDFDKDGDTVFMTMEYLEGTPLDKLIKKYRSTGLPVADSMQILEGICAALAYAHGQNIIHSDLKPGNIFVTNQNLAKVFDFGIARAVAKAEQDVGDTEDRTVFDAGNFGALTPAYASLEMLEGEPPDVRDDIYALGCIAYELLTGAHPFDRKNAKDAHRRGMKPDRITNINKQQWRVIERALAFERENRMATVGEFWLELNKKVANPFAVWSGVLVVLSVLGGGSYAYINREVAPVPAPLTADDFRSEIEGQIRLELLQKNIDDILQTKAFDERWEALLWEEMQNLEQLVGAAHPTFADFRGRAYALYLERIQELMQQQLYEDALAMIDRAKRYTSDTQHLASFTNDIQASLAEIEQRRQERSEQEQLTRQTQQDEQQKRAEAQQKRQEEERRREEYAVALATVSGQLRCTQAIDMGDFTVAIKKLRSLDTAQYQRAEGKIITDLATCLEKVGRNFPDRALAARDAALDLFPGNATLRALRLEQRDSCNESLAGFGARGRRSICQDALVGGVKSPETVVIPAKDNLPAFAIGRYEVTIAEFNDFCRINKSCKPLAAVNSSLPITSVTAQKVQEYLRWLSSESGKTYRLPTLAEWRLAAQAVGRGLDANRNCQLNARGIQKGGALLNADIGQQNSWGLVNYVGNAQEWVQGPGRQLLAVGGSYATEMEECTLATQRVSNGDADPETGFRVLRELVRR